jgi:hypothetical protein
MPDSKADVLRGTGNGLNSPSIGGATEIPEQSEAVTEEFAGDLFELPFKAWHVINPAVPDGIDDRVKVSVSRPFARILEKYGLGKIAKDEILVAFYLTQAISTNIIIIRREKKREQEEGKNV